MQSYYEHHTHRDSSFPFIFHEIDLVAPNRVVLHWHEAIELLYFESGLGTVISGNKEIVGYPGDLIVINANNAHRIESRGMSCQYKCAIFDPSFTKTLGVDLRKTEIQERIHDPQIDRFFMQMFRELRDREKFHQAEIKGIVTSLMVYLLRGYATNLQPTASRSGDRKVDIAKQAVLYIQENYQKPLTVDEISDYVGFSKYYLSRIFKEVAGSTITEHITHLRCENARKLIRSGNYNVSESAEQSGFNNLSYFTRCYKRVYGILPSEEPREQELIL